MENNEIKLPIWICENCGSKEVQQLAWVDLNTTNPNIDFFETNDVKDFWCKICSEHEHLIIKENE